MNRRNLVYAHLWVMIISLLMLSAISPPTYATTLQEEIDMGRKVDVEITKQMPLSRNQEAQKEMDEYGQQLVKGVNRTQIQYHFKILDEGTDLDAFSLPGGYVYFSQRMWDTMNKDERIGILGHEIAHVDRRHAIDAMSKAQKRQILAAVLLTAVGANRAWADVASLANSLYTLKFSRADEQQADNVSVELCQKAGYDPAGILLAMRKINRFQSEKGGQPPKILSTHPPTKDRIKNLEQVLASKQFSYPPEEIKSINFPDKIGEVAVVGKSSVEFASSKALKPGDVVWLMVPGWDFRYENRTMDPVARAVVRSTGTTVKADSWLMPDKKPNSVKKGIAIYAPPNPDIPAGIGRMDAPISEAKGKITVTTPVQKFDRLLLVQTVWDQKLSKPVAGNVGYIVITNPANNTSGYLAVSNPDYTYVPISSGSVMVGYNDPDQKLWMGPIISLGKSSQSVELLPLQTPASEKSYVIAHPQWNPSEDLEKRTVATAKLSSSDSKVVLKITSFSPGWDMSMINNGFDIYQEPVKQAQNKSK